MNEYLRNYLSQLSGTGAGHDFFSVTCRYGKFTMYCLAGPEERILHLTFVGEQHRQIQDLLAGLHAGVSISRLPQKDFSHNQMFAGYFAGSLTRLPIQADSPLLAAGTDFQQRVWRHIEAIPYGTSITYQQLAVQAGSPGGARAAGMACGANPTALLIPCHRVVAVNGLGGFAGGLAVKQALLTLEQGRSQAAE